MRTMRESVDSAPTAVVSTSSRPSAFTAPPVTLSPACLATGRLSPVISDSSTWLDPMVMTPSTGIRSPGRITTVSPTFTCASGTSMSPWGIRTRATSGLRALRAAMAAVVCRLARDSSHLPNSTSVTITAEASKYRCGVPCPACLNSR
ncbi:hypothetical protein FQZ97_828560 [compost metagenome]